MIVVGLLLFLAGCARITDEKGMILPEFIIYLTTGFKEIMTNESWFSAFFVWPLAEAINYLAPYTSILWAIVLVTVAINGLLFSFSVKSTVSSQKMQMIQPELNKITEKYKERKDDASRMAQAREMQNLYAKHDIKPFGSLFITFAQFPIIIAMYRAVQRAEAVVNASFMGSKLVETPMFGLKNGQLVLFIIFVIMAVMQFASMMLPQYLAKKRAMNKPRASLEENKTPNTMMMMIPMLGLILVLAINWPTAMSLYWLITSVVNIVKTLFIQWRYIDNEKV